MKRIARKMSAEEALPMLRDLHTRTAAIKKTAPVAELAYCKAILKTTERVIFYLNNNKLTPDQVQVELQCVCDLLPTAGDENYFKFSNPEPKKAPAVQESLFPDENLRY